MLLYFLHRCISYSLFHFPVWGRSSRFFPGGGARTVYLWRWNYMLGKDLPYFHWLVPLIVPYCLKTPLQIRKSNAVPLVSIHSAICSGNWRYNVGSWKGRSRRVWRTKRCIDFDAIILLTGRTASKRETDCIFCLKKATARFIHWYRQRVVLESERLLHALLQKHLQNIILVWKSKRFGRVRAYHWRHSSLTDNTKTCMAFCAGFRNRTLKTHNRGCPGKQSSPVIQGLLLANEESFSTHRNYMNATLKVK